MKMFMVVVAILLPTFAANACGDGSCDPDPPKVESPRGSTDNDPASTPTYYPCCIMREGGIKPKWDLFRTPEQVIKACQRALERGNATIYACEDSLPALK